MDRAKVIKAYLFLIGMVLVMASTFFIAPPSDYPRGSIITVTEGSSLEVVSHMLKEEKVVRSPLGFRAAAIFLGGEHSLKAGQYYLERPENPFILAWRMLRGQYEIETVKLTIPEGFTVKKISALFGEKFLFFDNHLFEQTAPEGYLFPDTYFLPITATASSTTRILRDNFIRKIFPVMPEVELSGHSLEEIITMASLIEGEANNQTDREMVSSILWKRLKLGMPLQVDVETKTYEFQGLPEAPINNPGLLSIHAALRATTTPYLYYLTGDDGRMYYSRTFEEHVANKQKYIR